MKAFYNLTVFAIIWELSNANADANPTERGLKHGEGGEGGGGHKGHKGHGGLRGRGFGDGWDIDDIKGMIEEKCNLESTCSNVDTNSLNCTFERPERDKHLDWGSATVEEISERMAAQDERKQRMLQCVCCTDATVEELLLRDKEGRPDNGVGGRWKGKDRKDFMKNMVEEKCVKATTCAKINADTLHCIFERPDRDERPDWISMSEEVKANFVAKKKAACEERQQKVLLCACCADKSIEEMFPSRAPGGDGREDDYEGEISVLMASSRLANEAEIQTQQDNAAKQSALSMALPLALVGVVLSIV